MASDLDKAPNLLVMQAESEVLGHDTLLEEATSALKSAGATFEVVAVPRAEDLTVATAFAIRGGNFDGVLVLASFDESEESLSGQVRQSVQKLAIDENQSLACGFSFLTGEQVARDEVKPSDTSSPHPGKAAAISALRLFALKNQFNPQYDES